MVVSVPAHESHHAPGLRHQLHPHRFVKSLRAVEIRDVEVYVTEHSAAREFLVRLARHSQEPLEIKMIGSDVQAAVRILPVAARATGVNLDPVPLRAS